MSGFAEWPLLAKLLAGLVALLLLALLWSVLASLVFLAGTRLLTRDTLPLLQFWQYLDAYGFHHPVVGPWLTLAAGSASGLPLLLVVGRIARQGWPGASGRPLHGQTRWATRAEVKRAGLRAGFGGLYVGQDARGRYLRFGGPEHVVCYAPTRSGKGVGLVIPNCLLYEASLVCLDVKTENWRATAGIRAEAGQKVFLFDPLSPDGRTARYNPFSYVRRGTLDAFEDIQRIAQMLFPHVAGDQQFWTESARSAFTGAAAFLAETPERPLTLGETLRLLSRADGPQEMLGQIEARRQQGRPYTRATVDALEDYLRGSPDLVNSIRKTITARLSLWFNPRIDAATAESDFDLRRLRHSLHAIYVAVTPDNIARLRPLLALFFQQLIDLTVRVPPRDDPSARHQVLLLLDEFPLLGPMPALADAFAYVAAYDVRLLLILQSKAQLRDRELYGPDKAEAILDNCGLEVVFGTKDLKSCEELSARLGFDTVEGVSRSGPRFWRAFRRDRSSETATNQRRALLLPQEIARLKPTEAILIRPGVPPVRCRRIRYFQDRTFSRLVREPPRVPVIDIAVPMDRGQPTTAANAAAASGTPAFPAPEVSRPTRPAKPASHERKTKARARKSAGEAVAGGAQDPGGEGENDSATGSPPSPSLHPHQADGLINAILGADIDLGDFALADAKAVVAAIVDAVPTVESSTSGRRRA